jgi:hypothetical protein
LGQKANELIEPINLIRASLFAELRVNFLPEKRCLALIIPLETLLPRETRLTHAPHYDHHRFRANRLAGGPESIFSEEFAVLIRANRSPVMVEVLFLCNCLSCFGDFRGKKAKKRISRHKFTETRKIFPRLRSPSSTIRFSEFFSSASAIFAPPLYVERLPLREAFLRVIFFPT